MSNVINLSTRRSILGFDKAGYQRKIQAMDKLELMEEMVRFQELRSQTGSLTLELNLKGLVLFRALIDNSETQEMKRLTSSYLRHLEYELKERK